MTKEQKALRVILYPVGIATLIYLAPISSDWGFYLPENLLSIPSWGSLFAAGCIGFALVSFILKDDITQYLPFLKRKPPRITLYTLSVISSMYLLYYYGATRSMMPPPYHIFGNGALMGIATGLTATFTAVCIGFAIISLILRDYVKQPPPFLKHKPLLIASYILAAIGGISLMYSWVLIPSVAVIPVVGVTIPELVSGVCIGLAAVSLAFRNALPSPRYRPLRIILYALITASFCWPVFYLAVIIPIYLFGGDPSSVVAFLFGLVHMIFNPTYLLICGSMGFIAATILLRGNMERNLSIAGKIIGVCLVIMLGFMLAFYPG